MSCTLSRIRKVKKLKVRGPTLFLLIWNYLCFCAVNLKIACLHRVRLPKNCNICGLGREYTLHTSCTARKYPMKIVYLLRIVLLTTTYLPMDEWTIKTPNPKCRLFFKIDLLTDFAALCLTDFIDWRHIHSWLVFSTQLVNCCPHGRRNYTCVLLPLYLLSDLPPPTYPK